MHDKQYCALTSRLAGPQQMCPVMSWLLCLCLWLSVTAIQLCQATFYDTIPQHPGTRPGRTTIHMIGESTTTVTLPALYYCSTGDVDLVVSEVGKNLGKNTAFQNATQPFRELCPSSYINVHIMCALRMM